MLHVIADQTNRLTISMNGELDIVVTVSAMQKKRNHCLIGENHNGEKTTVPLEPLSAPVLGREMYL